MSCLFCKIVKGEIPSKKIYEDDDIMAIADISPKAPVHLLVMPKRHLVSLQEIDNNDQELMGKLMVAVTKIANQQGIGKSGFKIVINNGQSAGQAVFHLHVHLMGGWKEKENWEV
jgi:histidine triad (HIT) family protein